MNGDLNCGGFLHHGRYGHDRVYVNVFRVINSTIPSFKLISSVLHQPFGSPSVSGVPATRSPTGVGGLVVSAAHSLLPLSTPSRVRAKVQKCTKRKYAKLYRIVLTK